jgi:hypothetical protein
MTKIMIAALVLAMAGEASAQQPRTMYVDSLAAR